MEISDTIEVPPTPAALPEAIKKNAASTATAECACTICPQKFDNMQECLKHELLEHSVQKKRPSKSLRQTVSSILKTFNEDEQLSLRTQVCQALSQCAAGEEVATILNYHRMNAENIELIYMRIRTCLKKELEPIGNFKIYPFGSIASGLALRDSDIDLYVDYMPHLYSRFSSAQRRNTHTGKSFGWINSLLRRSECFSEVFAIRQARVPIIKCKHSPTGFSLDINLSCPSSVHNTNFIRDLVKFDPRLHELMLFLKIWAKQLQIIGRGNMTSYCLIVLIIFYLQQPQQEQPALMPSVRKLQAKTSPNLVLGVNYAYDLQSRMKSLPSSVNVLSLIKGFFDFYVEFDFEHSLIAPYTGNTKSLEDFKSGKFTYLAYESQLRAIATANSEPSQPLQVEHCMCVQDPFCLNHNVAKSMSAANLLYFRKCLQQAQSICTKTFDSDAQLYEALLYDIIEKIARSYPGLETNSSSEQLNVNGAGGSGGLIYRARPSKSEMRALEEHAPQAAQDSDTLYRLWVEHYIEVITDIIAEVYCIDMQSASPTHNDKHQRLEHADRSRTWLLNASVDMWTGRRHARSSVQTFFEFQFAQTTAFKRERRQNAAYAVQFNGVLTLNIIDDHKAIEIIVSQPGSGVTGISKKDPLRKFFAMFKCSMQNFNLKEKLQLENPTEATTEGTMEAAMETAMEATTAASTSQEDHVEKG